MDGETMGRVRGIEWIAAGTLLSCHCLFIKLCEVSSELMLQTMDEMVEGVGMVYCSCHLFLGW